MTDESRLALATQLDQTIVQIADLINTQYAGKYIFGGKKTDQPPIVKNPGGDPPYLYQGDSEQMRVRVGPGFYVDAGVNGNIVLNMEGASIPSAPDLFQVIENVRDKILAADVNGISEEIANIDTILANIVAIRSQVGGRVSRLESSIQALSESKTRIRDLLSKTEDVDLAEAIVELRMRENVYQAAVAVANRILNVSLVNNIT
jgi:flagellar hook-associated protein 3 FlgL